MSEYFDYIYIFAIYFLFVFSFYIPKAFQQFYILLILYTFFAAKSIKILPKDDWIVFPTHAIEIKNKKSLVSGLEHHYYKNHVLQLYLMISFDFESSFFDFCWFFITW